MYLKAPRYTLAPEATEGTTSVCVDGEMHLLAPGEKLEVCVSGGSLEVFA